MKRTLVEILAGMAVLVLLVSFHHQINTLKTDESSVATLRQMVREAVSRSDGEKDQAKARSQFLEAIDDRLQELEHKIANASHSDDETQKLRAELVATKLEADRFKAEIARDVNRTKDLVDAYHKEFRALDRRATKNLSETQTHLEDLTARFLPDPHELNRELLAPTVQLNGDDTVGSGTMVYSQTNERSGEVESYVLTSYHVVRNILADSPSAKRNGISVTIYDGAERLEERADLVSQDERIDAALLKLRSQEQYDNLARIIALAEAHKVRVWERIYAVGCPLGNDPIPTQGEISSVSNELKGSNYWMINAPTYFGNSGGGVYLANSRELVGVFSKIYTHGRGNPVVVPHMGLCTPIDLIYAWLERDGYSFVVDDREESRAFDPSMLAAPPKD